MKRILVTGGAGFIGANLCDFLLSQGDHVICVDNLQSADPRNVLPLTRHRNFEFALHDVTSPMDRFGRLDQIYNLACPASPPHYQTDPINTMKTNIIGAMNVLDLALRTGARVLQASTSEIYGNPEIHPQREDYTGSVTTQSPRACYNEGKRGAETLFYDYARMHGVQTRIARIFNTYGPGMTDDDGRVVSNFILQALRGEDITIYGDGLQTRSFCYVSDLVDGLHRLMNCKGMHAMPCNIGNPDERTILDLATTIVKLVGSKSSIRHHDLPADDPVRRQPDISLARAQLGWEPRISLRDGLIRTIHYFETSANRQEMTEDATRSMVCPLTDLSAQNPLAELRHPGFFAALRDAYTGPRSLELGLASTVKDV